MIAEAEGRGAGAGDTQATPKKKREVATPKGTPKGTPKKDGEWDGEWSGGEVDMLMGTGVKTGRVEKTGATPKKGVVKEEVVEEMLEEVLQGDVF